MWFGPEDGPLFGWLHVPEDRQARGGVLLCPTLGIEAVSAHYAQRRLADRLSEAGFVTLRFDYAGTGDSGAPPQGAGIVTAWLASIRCAAAFLGRLGIGRTSVVGLRVGATLAAEAFGWGPAAVDDVVLWDPCPTGRAFLRDQRALWSFFRGGGNDDDGSVETPGLVYDQTTVADLSSLGIGNGDGPLADGVLLLTRSNRKADARMVERLAMPHVQRQSVVGQERLVDVEPESATPPYETIETIVEWLAARAAGGPTVSVDAAGLGRSRAVIGTAPDGAAVEEQVVSLGPHGLFGVLTARSDYDDASTRPTILFLNAGSSSHVGPARLWVHLGRSWAEAGFRVLRFDLSGIGDSPGRADRSAPIVWAPGALDDVLEVLADVAPGEPSNAILVGLCSGAYHALESALANQVRGVCVVNPMLSFVPPEDDSTLEVSRQVSAATKRWARSLPGYDFLGGQAHRLPDAAWWIINRVAVKAPPARSLTKVLEAGVNVYVIAGDYEARLLSRGEARTMRRLNRSRRFRMEVIPDLEHSLFERHGRELATKLLTEHVIASFG
jgi:alpha-beta hydrolase superfamily lysophospholipase